MNQCTSTVDLGGPLRCTLPAGHTGWHRAESLQWGDQARGITQSKPEGEN